MNIEHCSASGLLNINFPIDYYTCSDFHCLPLASSNAKHSPTITYMRLRGNGRKLWRTWADVNLEGLMTCSPGTLLVGRTPVVGLWDRVT